jgi:hypothetical protein
MTRPRWARRKPVAAAPSRWPPMPSLDLLLQTVMAERDKQLAHFDALDTKAGVLLAFDGVLLAFQRSIRAEFQVPGTVLAAASAGLALWAFWPRKFPALDPVDLRKYLTYETEQTRLMLHDTIGEMITRGAVVLGKKALRLRLALVGLLLAAITLGAGVVVSTHATSSGRTNVKQEHGTTGGTTPSPSPSASR